MSQSLSYSVIIDIMIIVVMIIIIIVVVVIIIEFTEAHKVNPWSEKGYFLCISSHFGSSGQIS